MGIDPGATVKLTGAGRAQIFEGGVVHITGGTFELNGKSNNGADFYVEANGSKIAESTGTGTWFTPNSTTLNANLEIASAGGELYYNNMISGVGSITKTGGGTVIFNNNTNDYSGKTAINGGVCASGPMAASARAPTRGPVADQLTLDGGILMNNSSNTIITENRGITLGAAGGGLQAGWGQSLTINSKITGQGQLTIKYDSVPGTIYLTNAGNDYSGGTTVEQGAILALTSPVRSAAAASRSTAVWI